MTTFTMETANTLFSSSNDFPVDFNAAFVWLEYTRKDNAFKAFLDCKFTENTHYIVKTQNVNGKQEKLYFLTLECFKHWGMMSRTDAGVTIRDYFIECERISRSKFTEDLNSIEKFGNFAKAWELKKKIEELEKQLTSIYKRHPQIRLAFAQLSVSEDLERSLSGQNVSVTVHNPEA
jgi:anti-repressor protein